MLLLLVFNVLPVGSVDNDFFNIRDYFDLDGSNGSSFAPRNDNHHNIIDYNFHHPPPSQGINQYAETLVPVQATQVSPFDKLTGFFHQPEQLFVGKKKRKKKKHLKKFALFGPIILTAIAKLAHLIPVAKLILLALFALVLFAKKAFLVSVGSLILVLYDTFYKSRGVEVSVHQSSKHEPISFAEDHKDDWWENNTENQTAKINPRDAEKLKRWWRYYEPVKRQQAQEAEKYRNGVIPKIENFFKEP